MGTLISYRVGLIWAAKRHPMVLNPFAAMEGQIHSSASHIDSYFSDIDSALDNGSEVKEAVAKGVIRPVMRRLISSSRTLGFQHAAAISKKRMPILYGREVSDIADRRAKRVDKMMRKTTRRRLKNTPDSDYILGKSRALAASQYEASRSYFRGVKDALSGSGLGKRWITTAMESCEDCLANEDEGTIGVDEQFQSGDLYPAAHLNCPCSVEVVRI